MFGQEKICYFRWRVCLFTLCLFGLVWCDDPCPLIARESTGAKAPSIPAYDIEYAFYMGDSNVQYQRQRSRSGRVYPKGMKIAETVHPQANQKSEVPKMEAKQRIFDEASRYLASTYALSPTRVTCGLPKIYPTGEAAERAMEACVSKGEIECSSTDQYRTADGTCNNLDHPTWGSAFSSVDRLLPPSPTDYNGMRRSVGCENLPDPRYLSNVLHSYPGKRSPKVNHLYVYFGQFLTHDMTSTAQTTTENNDAIQCCPPRPDNHPQCAQMDTSASPIYGANSTCMNFVRSAIYPSCSLGHRRQINTATSFIDGSQIYGNSLHEMNSLRARDGTGKLLVQSSPVGNLLPRSFNPNNDRCSVPQNNQYCFQAGDTRVNQNPMLASMHTLWVREHNRIAETLKNINQHWDEERLFQESRRIVIAELQHIVRTEYLPLTLGDKYLRYFEDTNPSYNMYTNYQNGTKPNIYTEFSTAAFRFGHSMVDTSLPELPRRPGHYGHSLRDRFADPFGLYEGEVDFLMMGASKAPAQALDRSLVTDLTNYLYRTRGQQAGLDLAALNIQRGRDHALPGYFDVYNACYPQEPIESFFDLDDFNLMTTETVNLLRMVYRDVKDVDLWTGIILEMPAHDGILGRTGSCIVTEQFGAVMNGDRFWYAHKDEAGSFTEGQRYHILGQTSLSGIICANTNVTEMPQNAMQLVSSLNYIRRCSGNRPPPYLYAWEEHT